MPIALLSDFGLRDSYVGAMKGVLARLAPNAAVIDISHEIPPFDVIEAGLKLFQAFSYFPRKTVFVAVVDPGVGSSRRAILVETEDYFFLGPDNGLLSMALAEQKIRRIVELKNDKYFLQPVSPTFHGRDIFAPVAAHLSQGLSAEFFGPELTGYERLPAFLPKRDAQEIRGQILTFDRFGSAISNLSRAYLARYFQGPVLKVEVAGLTLEGLGDHYAEAAANHPFLIFGSSQLLEISVNQGSAESVLRLSRGETLRIALGK
ncbi:MAG TPA: SAM-dependent chlorinase/fluorinase [bacterium]|nr:SAM-dependent chlorinase/fluorinase [bacterium]